MVWGPPGGDGGKGRYSINEWLDFDDDRNRRRRKRGGGFRFSDLFSLDFLSEPLTLVEIADHAGLSRRQIERLFRHHMGRSPARYYLEIRLDRARHLLLQSILPVVEVAIACGFVSASHFSKCYRELYGRSPQQERAERQAEAA